MIILSGGEGMEYTIQKLGKIAGVSTRTLRYYDEIGLLKPARVNSSGYRIYGSTQIARLQQILFYRELGFALESITKILNSTSFDAKEALAEHRACLLKQKERLDLLIANVEKTIAEAEGRITMMDKEKFEGFKQKMVDENEAEYGKEIREKYGDDAVNESNRKVMDMSQADMDKANALAQQIKDTLAAAFKTGDSSGELAQKAAELHKQWLCFYWPKYTKEAHAGVAQMYVDDERFTAYYDTEQPGTAAFFRDAIHIFTGIDKS